MLGNILHYIIWIIIQSIN